MNKHCDVLIVGGGIAGLYAALTLADSLDVTILTKDKIEVSNSYLAQGGIAAAISADDKPEYHLDDTLKVGAGVCDLKAVQVLVNEAEENIHNLHKLGVVFDQDKGKLALTREGGHSKSRILHIDGDATGRGIVRALAKDVWQRKNITVRENSFGVDLIVQNGCCVGVLVLEDNQVSAYYAKAVILATGGIGMVYGVTTNADTATGDAIGMANRAGVQVVNMEFIQFHPTVFYSKEKRRFLISEALRGEGAILKNLQGERFMQNYDSRGELAPRDVVARAIYYEMKKTATDHVYLDATHLPAEFIPKRFPNIYAKCRQYGLDITTEMIPVSPAQHYCMGGIKTDLYGKTNLPGLYACGETACTGVHGANRLASNSLLEAVVFANRAAQQINEEISQQRIEFAKELPAAVNFAAGPSQVSTELTNIQTLMREYAGIVRNDQGLEKCLLALSKIEEKLQSKAVLQQEYFECLNILATAKLIAQQARHRKKSVGAHYLIKRGEVKDELVFNR
ncbi:L-aspartate oxidase [Bacillota bacterium LX-D]|nr:L-aspartate oxidase [Bacillota bacterium LX-D]